MIDDRPLPPPKKNPKPQKLAEITVMLRCAHTLGSTVMGVAFVQDSKVSSLAA